MSQWLEGIEALEQAAHLALKFPEWVPSLLPMHAVHETNLLIKKTGCSTRKHLNAELVPIWPESQENDHPMSFKIF
jgi:hypothetical protein